MAFSYSDGAEIEGQLLDRVRSSSDLRSLTSIADWDYGRFPIRYHLSPERANLLRHLSFAGLDVLELGAGMGAVSRFIAEEAEWFTAVEGSPARFEVLKSRLRDLDNWTGTVANIQDFTSDRKFDVVCLIGVLEYSDVYIDHASPFEWVLRHAANLLKEDGVLLLAIENQQGIKYFAGAPEDHTGRLFDGVCGYSIGKSPRTFSRAELLSMIERCGYGHVEEFFPWPDYKLPSVVVSGRMLEIAPSVAGEMASDAVEKGLAEGPRYFPEALAILELSRTGRHAEFANSFLFASAKTSDSKTLAKLLSRMQNGGEVAWHYSVARKDLVTTTLRLSGGELVSAKQSVGMGSPSNLSRKQQTEEPVLLEERFSTRLEKRAFFGETEEFFEDLEAFLRWSFGHWGIGDDQMQPDALDAIVTNTVVTDHGEYRQFDLEWRWHEPIRKSWFILRNVVSLRHAWRMNPKPRFETLGAMYEGLCNDLGVRPDFETDLEIKAFFHSQVSADSDMD